MNKIFRVIWNHSTQSWVATSELAKSKTKTKSVSTTTAAAAVAAAVAVMAGGEAQAAMAVVGDNQAPAVVTATGGTGDNVVVGVNNQKDGEFYDNAVLGNNNLMNNTSKSVILGRANDIKSHNKMVTVVGSDNTLEQFGTGGNENITMVGSGNTLYSSGSYNTTILGSLNNVAKGDVTEVYVGQFPKTGAACESLVVGNRNTLARGVSNIIFGINNTIRNGSNSTYGNVTVIGANNSVPMGLHDGLIIGRDSTWISRNRDIYGLPDQRSGTGNGRKIGDEEGAGGRGTIGIGFNVSSLFTGSGQPVDNAYIFGKDSRAAGNAMAFGVNAYAGNQKNIAIGFDTGTYNGDSIAIGNHTTTLQSGGIAIGSKASVVYPVSPTAPQYSGWGTRFEKGGIAIGQNVTVGGFASTALGYESGIGDKSATYKIINNLHGTTARKADLDALEAANRNLKGSLALGTQAWAQASHDIAIGRKATTATSEKTRVATKVGSKTVKIKDGTYYEVDSNGTPDLTKPVAVNRNNAPETDPSNQIAIGNEAETHAINSIAMGNRTRAFSNHSIAIGDGAQAGLKANAPDEKVEAIAIGKGAIAKGEKSISIGTGNEVRGDKSAAIGDPSLITGNGTYVIGNDNGQFKNTKAKPPIKSDNPIAADNAFIFGHNNNMTADGSRSFILGHNNTVNFGNTFVMGHNVTASQANSVILGNNSTDRAATTEASGTVKGITYGDFAGQGAADKGVVSVGKQGGERQIINVASGKIAADSTDAINGSQLYLVTDRLGNVAATTAKHLGGGVTVGADGNLTAPVYNVVKGSKTPKTAGDSTTNFNAAPYNNVGAAIAGLNTYVNQGFNVTDNGNTVKGVVTPTETVNFHHGVGTESRVTEEANSITKVTFDVKYDENSLEINGDGKLAVKASGGGGWKLREDTDANTAKHNVRPNAIVTFQGKENSFISTSISANNGNPIVSIDLQKTDTPTAAASGELLDPAKNPKKRGGVVTSTELVEAVNNSGWRVTVDKKAGTSGSATAYTEEAIIRPGNMVEFIAGNGIELVQGELDGTYPTGGGNKVGQKIVISAKVPETTTVGVNEATGAVTNVAAADQNKPVTAGSVATALQNLGFKLKASAEAGKGEKLAGSAKADGEMINTSDEVEMIAGKNMTVKHDTEGKITYATKDDVEFNSVQLGNTQTGPKLTADGDKIKVSKQDGTTAAPITNIDSGLKNYAAPNTPKAGLRDLTNNTAAPDSNAATVGDLRNLGWIVSAEKDTNNDKAAYADKVTNAQEVKFVGVGATVTGNTTNGVRTITIMVDPPKDVAGNLEPTYNTGDAKDENGKIGSKDEQGNITANEAVDAPTTAQTAPEATKVQEIYNNGATVGDVLNAGWNLQGNGAAVDFVKPYDTVNFADGTGTTIEATADENGKVSTIKVHTVMQYTDKDGSPVKKVGDKYYPADSVVAKDGTVYEAGTQLEEDGSAPAGATPAQPLTETPVVSMVNGAPNTDNNETATTKPTTLANVKGALKRINNDPSDTATITNPDGSEVTPAAGEPPLKGQKEAPNTLDEVKALRADTAVLNTAATVGDVLNTGFNLKENGTDKDFVRHADTVNFINGTGTTVTVTPNEDGTANEIRVDTVMQYTDAAGNPVVKVGDEYYKAEDVENGVPKQGKQPIEGSPRVSLVGGDNSSTTPTVLGNVAEGANTYGEKGSDENTPLVKVGDKYYNANDLTNGVPNENAQPVDLANGTELAKPADKARSGLADLEHSNANNAMTVADAKKMGWIVSADKTTGAEGTPYAANVTNAQEVRFVGKGLNVTGLTTEEVRTITIEVPAGNLAPTYNKGDAEDQNGKIGSKNDQGVNTPNAPVAQPTKAQKAPDANKVQDVYNNAASVGDVLNAGWNLQGNGAAVDFVKPYDTVNFADGTGTTIEATADADGKVSTIKVNTLVQYTDAAGNPVTVIDGKGYAPGSFKAADGNVYPADSVVAKDGTVYPAGTQLEEGGEAPAGATPATPSTALAEKPRISLVDTAKTSTTPTVLGNIGSGLNTKDVTTNTGKTPVSPEPTDPNAPKENPGTASNVQLIDLVGDNNNPVDANTAVTVGDLQKYGWVIEAENNEYKQAVKNAQEVNIRGIGGVEVKGKTEGEKYVLEVGLSEAGTLRKKKIQDAAGTGGVGAQNGDQETGEIIVNSNAGGFVSAGNIAQAINQSGFKLKATAVAGGERDIASGVAAEAQDLIHPGDTMNLVAGKNIKIKHDEANRESNITVSTAENVTFSSVTIGAPDANNNNQPKANAPKLTSNDNGDLVLNGAPSEAGNANSAPKPVSVSNVKGNLAPAYNNGDKKEDDNRKLDAANAAAPTDVTKSQTITPEDVAKVYNNAATAGDVLNAGFNLQGNGKAVDFVKTYDTVNFADGTGTTIEATADADGKVSTIKVNTVMQYTDAKGTPVTVIDGKGYAAGSIKGPDGKVYPAGTTFDEQNNPTNGATEAPVLTAAPKVSLVNGDKTSTTPTVLGNVAQGTNTYADKGSEAEKPLVKVGDKYYAPDQFENGQLKDDAVEAAAPVDLKEGSAAKARTGLADLNNSNANNAMSVADAKNLGWIVSSDKKTGGTGEYADKVTNAQEVRFVGKDGVKVSGNTTTEGVRLITVELEKGEVVKSNEFVIVDKQTKAETPVVKVGNDYYKVADIDPTTGAPKDGTTPLTVDETKVDVVNKGNNFVNGNQVADAIQASGWTVGKATADEVAATTFNAAADPANNEKVNPNDHVRFADGVGTVVSTGTVKSTDKDGSKETTTTIKVDVDLPIAFKYVDADGKEYAKAADGKFYEADKVNPNGTLKPVAPNTAAPTPLAPEKVATLSKQAQLTNGINEHGVQNNAYEQKDPVIAAGVDAVKTLLQANPNATAEEIKAAADKAVSDKLAADPAAKDTIVGGTGGVHLNNVAWAEKPDQAVNLDQLKQTVEKSGFYVQQNGKSTLAANADSTDVAKTEKVTPEDVVNFNHGENTEMVVSTSRNPATGVDTTNVSVNVLLPIVHTDAEGNKVTKRGNKFFKVDPTTGAPTTEEVAAGDLVASMATPQVDDQGNVSYNTSAKPMAIQNVEGTLKRVANDGKVSNPDGTTDNEVTTGQTAAPNTAAEVKALHNKPSVLNTAATMGDVLNTGFNLQENGTAKDFVRHADTVNFVNGTGTTVTVTPNAEGTANEIRVDTVMQYTDAAGNPITVIDGKGYDLGSIKGPDGKIYPKGTKFDAQNNPLNGATEAPVTSEAPKVSIVSGAPMALGNVAQGANTYGAKGSDANTPLVKVGDKYYKATDIENGAPKQGATPVDLANGTELAKPADKARSGLADLNNSNANNAISVSDAKNLGWVVSADRDENDRKNKDKSYADQVINAKQVHFKGEGGLVVSGKTDADGVRTIVVSVAEEDAANPKLKVANKANVGVHKHSYAKGEMIKEGDAYIIDGNGAQILNAGEVVQAINDAGFRVKVSATAEGKRENGTVVSHELITPGDELNLRAGKNMSVTHDKNGVVTYATKDDVEFSSVKVGDVNINADGINAGNKVISNVAPGVRPNDAVNVSQLKGAVNNLDNKIRRNRAGIAGANAAVGLPQVYIPGKSMVAASAGTFKGESAIAVGYSRASDNGKLILKLQGNANTRGDFGGSVGVGYQW